MTDLPILFTAPMVRALLDGRKTQTRRLLPLPAETHSKILDFVKVATDKRGRSVYEMKDKAGEHVYLPKGKHFLTAHFIPRYAVGDRLYVKESWWIATRYSYGTTAGGCEIKPPPLAHRKSDPIRYAADGDAPNCANKHYGPDGLRPGSGAFAAPDPYAVWLRVPSIHMPRWASRITLMVTDVRVERLRDISEANAIAEGIESYGGVDPDCCGYLNYENNSSDGYWLHPVASYASLWNHINGSGAWDANPWVAAYTFTVINQNIDRIAA